MEKNICSWCGGGSALDIGSGIFSDFDSDCSYGIPVCPGCGGLGVTVNEEKFEALRSDIFRLRFEYCPVSGNKKLTEEEKEQKKKELLEAVRKIYERYGDGCTDCYAKKLLE